MCETVQLSHFVLCNGAKVMTVDLKPRAKTKDKHKHRCVLFYYVPALAKKRKNQEATRNNKTFTPSNLGPRPHPEAVIIIP